MFRGVGSRWLEGEADRLRDGIDTTVVVTTTPPSDDDVNDIGGFFGGEIVAELDPE